MDESTSATSHNAGETSHNAGESSGAAEEPAGRRGDSHGAIKGSGTGKGTGKGTLKGGGKKKGKGADGPACANCGEEGDARCTGCGMVHYCRKNIVIKNGKKVNMCQQVCEHSRAPHWL